VHRITGCSESQELRRGKLKGVAGLHREGPPDHVMGQSCASNLAACPSAYQLALFLQAQVITDGSMNDGIYSSMLYLAPE